ncbi:DUF1631 family protein [Marinobacter xiaoshiensis]|uniref:DUF1631 family protein n=1 Tax=Marinobacter xiaoshiensis TaxID=3073652 RepID=A0ABU2HIR9_9GAMM|nr:DUF1631 family protein [Marinobacter sp. F60267]MDS1310471.1 DUF1631 family protein [Marinobacter sp. F60267]
MSQNRPKSHQVASRKAVAEKIDDVLAGIRVPDLPYPVGKLSPETASDWKPLLFSCWTEQRNERVTHVIRSVHLEWSVRQINAAYVADRIMDVFLKTSGLHAEIARRIARLRFYLAWRMDLDGHQAFSNVLLEWLDSLQEWRGWSDSGGRSSKALLDQLDTLVVAVSAAFDSDSTGAVDTFCEQWQEDSAKRDAQTGRLRLRLQETEQGAARQRRAEQTSRALIGRALQGRKLPQPVLDFIFDHWQGLLKQAVWDSGVNGETCRHGSKLLEWLVWVGDPSLSDKDRDRLYHVGEQIGDRLVDVWGRVFDRPLTPNSLAGIGTVMMSRLRGDTPELIDALPESRNFSWNPVWLSFEALESREFQSFEGMWFVQGEGESEQRRFFCVLLEDTAEILWTNGTGVKLGLQPWEDFCEAKEIGKIRPLPAPTPFGNVLEETVQLLAAAYEKQRVQREAAAAAAKARAEALRKEREAAELARQQQEAERLAMQERQRREAEDQRLADEQAEQERLYREKMLVAQKQVDEIGLGGWIVVKAEEPETEDARLKLAVRTNASRKLIFVDRLGLNRREFLEDELVLGIVEERIRVMGGAAEFDDTLSRVVGRIRVGRN